MTFTAIPLAIALGAASMTATAWQNDYEITDPYNPTNSYTVKEQFGGGYRMQNRYDPTDSYDIKPRFGGGSTMTNTYNPADVRIIKPMFPQFGR